MALRRALHEESIALAKTWVTLSKSVQKRVFADDEILRRTFEDSLALPLLPEQLPTWRSRLPELVLLQFVTNVAAAMLRETALPLPYVKLLLEHAFPPRSPARELFYDDPSPSYSSYESALRTRSSR